MGDLRIGVLASHEGTTAQAIIDACHAGHLAGQVVLVVSNNGDAEVLRRADRAGVPCVHLSGRTHPDPDDLDAAILAALTNAGVSVVVLAGYMKRIGAGTLSAYAGRILNTHPALLPAYGGLGMYGDRVHAAVLAAGETTTGASVLMVATGEYDQGPVVDQATVPVLPTDDVSSLGERVRAAEKALLLSVLGRL